MTQANSFFFFLCSALPRAAWSRNPAVELSCENRADSCAMLHAVGPTARRDACRCSARRASRLCCREARAREAICCAPNLAEAMRRGSNNLPWGPR
ncbi:hypothetical protein GUJ93_ZPchr0013g36958 [Zizania palustris]|uniref:Secreted protein n=1 Tax=Zizania palustris TaxID=103762 RepID=A0A8J5WZG0_ZIZPA|nr:hypothetical protein GUJ93_ZPchr0013g36958 [Zizania palustris]